MDIKWFFKGTNALFTYLVLGGIPAMAILLAMGTLPVVSAAITGTAATVLAARYAREVTR